MILVTYCFVVGQLDKSGPRSDSAPIWNPLLPIPGPGACYTESMTDDHAFRSQAEAALDQLKKHLFTREDASGDFETEEQGGVLMVVFEDPPAKFVITANTPARQIWISALTTSFKLDPDAAGGGFTLAKSGEALLVLLDRLIDEQLRADG